MKIKLKKVQKANNKKNKFTAIFEVDGKEKKINFGAVGYRDFTLMNTKTSEFYEPDKKKRDIIKDRYQKRHKRNLSTAQNPQGLGAAALSYYILWTVPTVKGGIREYLKIFENINK